MRRGSRSPNDDPREKTHPAVDPNPRSENGSSSRIYLDMRFTPNPQQLGGLIDYAKGKNLRVVLMPPVSPTSRPPVLS